MRIPVVLISALFLLPCSCRHYYYVANMQNVPVLKEKGEVQISGSFGGWDESNGLELQSAYAVSDKVGITANFLTAWGGEVAENDYARGSYFDFAAGYFGPVRKNFEFEIYGGMGISGQRHRYLDFDYDPNTDISTNVYGSSRLSFVKPFIQPSFSLTHEHFEAIVSTRLCRVSYTAINSTAGNEWISTDLDPVRNKSHYFLEPALTLRAGAKNVKVQVQFVYVRYLNNSWSYFYEDAHLTGGVHFVFPVNNQK